MFPICDLYLQALHRLQFSFLTSSVVITCQRFKGALEEGIHTRQLSPIIFLFPLPAPSASSLDLFVLFVLLQLFSLYKNVLQSLNWPYRTSGKVWCVKLTFSRLHTKASSNIAAKPLVIPFIWAVLRLRRCWPQGKRTQIFEKCNPPSGCGGRSHKADDKTGWSAVLLSFFYVAWCLKQHCATRRLHERGRRNTLTLLYMGRASQDELLLPSREPETCCSPGVHGPNDNSLPDASSHNDAQRCASRHSAWYSYRPYKKIQF